MRRCQQASRLLVQALGAAQTKNTTANALRLLWRGFQHTTSLQADAYSSAKREEFRQAMASMKDGSSRGPRASQTMLKFKTMLTDARMNAMKSRSPEASRKLYEYVAMFEEVCREGLKTISPETTLPEAKYIGDQTLVDEYYKALSYITRNEGRGGWSSLLASLQAADDLLRGIGQSSRTANWYGLVAQLYKDLRKGDAAVELIEELRSKDIKISPITYLHATIAMLRSRLTLDELWPHVQAALAIPVPDNSEALGHWRDNAEVLLNALVKTCSEQGAFDKAMMAITTLHSSGLAIDPSSLAVMLLEAAQADHVLVVHTALSLLVPEPRPGKSLPHYALKITPAPTFKVSEGLLLEALNCAVRKKDAGLAEMAFNMISPNLAKSNYHTHQYYSQLKQETPAEMPPEVPESLTVPSTPAFHALIHTYVLNQNWRAAFETMEKLAEAYETKKPATLSCFHGMSYFVEEMKDEMKAAYAYSELQRRINNKQPVTAAMVNVILRGLARNADSDKASRLFDEFANLNIKPNVDTFNAVLESCVYAKKVTALQPVVDYMTKEGCEPNDDTADLLLRGHILAGDCDGVGRVLQNLSKKDFALRNQTLHMALALADRERAIMLRGLVTMELSSRFRDLSAHVLGISLQLS